MASPALILGATHLPLESTPCKDRWGIFHAQPFVLNERQAGVAIEGVIRQEKLETSQLAVDTHGYTDFAMSHARCLVLIFARG